MAPYWPHYLTAAAWSLVPLLAAWLSLGTVVAMGDPVINAPARCAHCEPGAMCVQLEQAWINKKSSKEVTIHLPTAHLIARNCSHDPTAHPLRYVIVRARLSALAPSLFAKSQRFSVSTGPNHRLPSPAKPRGQQQLASEEVPDDLEDAFSLSHPLRCRNTFGRRLPSLEAVAHFCPANSAAVIVQDPHYNSAGISMTCAFCPDPRVLISTSTVGPQPELDILLPVLEGEEAVVHLVVAADATQADTKECHVRCERSHACLAYDQICDGVSNCESGEDLDETSPLCPLVRYERSRRMMSIILATVGALLTAVGLIIAAVIISVRRARTDVKSSDQNSLSLVDKAPLI